MVTGARVSTRSKQRKEDSGVSQADCNPMERRPGAAVSEPCAKRQKRSTPASASADGEITTRLSDKDTAGVTPGSSQRAPNAPLRPPRDGTAPSPARPATIPRAKSTLHPNGGVSKGQGTTTDVGTGKGQSVSGTGAAQHAPVPRLGQSPDLRDKSDKRDINAGAQNQPSARPPATKRRSTPHAGVQTSKVVKSGFFKNKAAISTEKTRGLVKGKGHASSTGRVGMAGSTNGQVNVKRAAPNRGNGSSQSSESDSERERDEDVQVPPQDRGGANITTTNAIERRPADRDHPVRSSESVRPNLPRPSNDGVDSAHTREGRPTPRGAQSVRGSHGRGETPVSSAPSASPRVSNRTGSRAADRGSSIAVDGSVSRLADREVQRSIREELQKMRTHVGTGLQDVLSRLAVLESKIDDLVVVERFGAPVQAQLENASVKSKFEDAMRKHIVHFNHVVNTSLLQNVLVATVFTTFTTVLGTGVVDVSEVSDAISAMMFGLLPSEKKEVMSSGIGQDASKFRRLLVWSTLFHVHKDTFGLFKETTADVGDVCEGETSSGVNNAANAVSRHDDGRRHPILRPTWCEKGFLTRFDLEAARAADEKCGTGMGKAAKMRIIEGGTPSRHVIATHAISELYKVVRKTLHSNRERGKTTLFEELCMYFVPWNEEKVKVSASSLQVSWAYESASTEPLRYSDVPDCSTDTTDDVVVEEKNRKTFEEFMESRKEMLLLITHDVFIKDDTSIIKKRSRRQKDPKKLCRMVNLLQVAGCFIGSFCGYPHRRKVWSLLRYNKRSLATLYAVAVLLRELVVQFTDDWALVAEDVRKTGKVIAGSVRFSDLIPAPTAASRVLEKITSALPLSLYNSLHVVAGEGAKSTGDVDDRREVRSADGNDEFDGSDLEIADIG